jgi:hypothetical protein
MRAEGGTLFTDLSIFFQQSRRRYAHFADLSIFSQIFRSFSIFSQIFRSFGNRPPLPPTHAPAQPTPPRFHPHTHTHTPTLPRTHAPHTHVQAHPLAHPRPHSPHTRQAHKPAQAPTHTRTRAPPPHVISNHRIPITFSRVPIQLTKSTADIRSTLSLPSFTAEERLGTARARTVLLVVVCGICRQPDWKGRRRGPRGRAHHQHLAPDVGPFM